MSRPGRTRRNLLCRQLEGSPPISSGLNYTCGVRVDGSVECRGKEASRLPSAQGADNPIGSGKVQVRDVKDVKAMSKSIIGLTLSIAVLALLLTGVFR